jgi:uncharacterized membrane protein
MKRSEFFYELRKELQGLSFDEVEDIVRDHEEMLTDGIAAGKSEEELLSSFGKPQELARALKAQNRIDKASEEKVLSKQLRGVLGAVGALLVLAPFNLIFVLGPFCALLGVLIGGWAAGIAVSAVALALLVVFFSKLIFVSASVWVYLSLFFGFLGCIGAASLVLIAMYFVTRFFAKLLLSYLKWNLNFIKSREL